VAVAVAAASRAVVVAVGGAAAVMIISMMLSQDIHVVSVAGVRSEQRALPQIKELLPYHKR
jgi:hypothetical protein